MKKIIVLAFITVIPLNAMAQTDKPYNKGNILTGGSISVNFEKDLDINPDVTYTTNRKGINTNINLSYFIINKLAIGLKTDLLISSSYRLSSLNSERFWEMIDNNFFIGPNLRYYFKANIFLEGFAGFGFLHNFLKEDPAKWRNFLWSGGIGYSIFLSRSVSVEPIIKYNSLTKNAYENEDGKEISRDLVFSIGFQIFLNPQNENK